MAQIEPRNPKIAIVAFALLLAIWALSGPSRQVYAQSDRAAVIGTELDLLPFLFQGYYASAVAGIGHWRGRLVATEVTVPDFVTPTGFKDNRLTVQALVVDYFFAQGFSGWWVGPGVEQWRGKVTNKSNGQAGSYSTQVFTAGGGYVYRLGQHVYLNPWAAVHVPAGGDRSVSIGGAEFDINPAAEASLKLGLDW